MRMETRRCEALRTPMTLTIRSRAGTRSAPGEQPALYNRLLAWPELVHLK
jgi:hypothetical protein